MLLIGGFSSGIVHNIVPIGIMDIAINFTNHFANGVVNFCLILAIMIPLGVVLDELSFLKGINDVRTAQFDGGDGITDTITETVLGINARLFDAPPIEAIGERSLGFLQFVADVGELVGNVVDELH